MTQLSTLDELNDCIRTEKSVLIYFSSQNCSVCSVLKPKLEEELSNVFTQMKLYEVKADHHKEIASSFSVFSFPTLLVFLDGHEFFREGKNISIHQFIENLKRPYTLLLGQL